MVRRERERERENIRNRLSTETDSLKISTLKIVKFVQKQNITTTAGPIIGNWLLSMAREL